MFPEAVKSMTQAEFLAFAESPESGDHLYEFIHGEVVQMPTPSNLHNFVVMAISAFLYNFVRQYQLGYVFGDATSYALPTGQVFIPDTSFISKERSGWPLPNRFYTAPDLAVEVMSPSNDEEEMLDKVETYLAAGTSLVWVVYPQTQRVRAYRTQGEHISYTIHNLDSALDGGTVLPALHLPVRDIFPGER